MSLLTMLRWHVAIVWRGFKAIRLVDTRSDVLVRQCFKPRPNERNISTQHSLDNVGRATESSGKTITSFERHFLRKVRKLGLRLVFTGDYDSVAYDLVKTALSESQAEAEE